MGIGPKPIKNENNKNITSASQLKKFRWQNHEDKNDRHQRPLIALIVYGQKETSNIKSTTLTNQLDEKSVHIIFSPSCHWAKKSQTIRPRALFLSVQ